MPPNRSAAALTAALTAASSRTSAANVRAVDSQSATLRFQALKVVGRAHRIAGISHRPGNIEGRDPDSFAGQGQGRLPGLAHARHR